MFFTFISGLNRFLEEHPQEPDHRRSAILQKRHSRQHTAPSFQQQAPISAVGAWDLAEHPIWCHLLPRICCLQCLEAPISAGKSWKPWIASTHFSGQELMDAGSRHPFQRIRIESLGWQAPISAARCVRFQSFLRWGFAGNCWGAR